MIRSGTAGMAAVAFGTLAASTAVLLAILQLFTGAAVLGGVWLAATAVGTSLMLRADPQQLSDRAEANARRVDGWARGPDD